MTSRGQSNRSSQHEPAIKSLPQRKLGDFAEEQQAALRAVYLSRPDVLSQEEIAEILNVKSQAEVSRLLKKAQAWGLAEKWHINLPRETVESVEQSIFSKHRELKDKLERIRIHNKQLIGVKKISVYHIPQRSSTPDGSAPQGEDGMLQTFGRLAVDAVVPLLKSMQTKSCVVAWGRTIRWLIEAIPKQSYTRDDLTIMPCAGEPLGLREAEFSASAAARKLASAFGCESLSLAGSSARIPHDLLKYSTHIKDYVSRCGDYARIFGGSVALIDSADVIITGIGDMRTSEKDRWFGETMHSISLTPLDELRAELRENAAGNIGGVWLPADSANTKHRQAIEKINEGWLGIQYKHLESCARRCSGEKDGPGVVVVAAGRDKANILAHIVGVVNHLVIDTSLANAVLDDLDGDGHPIRS
jgi:DNA-binding transcriptional regulator LsrR (DeoR family)